MTEIIARHKHNNIIRAKSKLDTETRTAVSKSVKAMFMHKVGGVLVETTDSIIISAFISVGVLGKYSNYTSIMLSMYGIISLVFISLTSVIGHMFVEDNREKIYKYFKLFYLVNYIIGLVFF